MKYYSYLLGMFLNMTVRRFSSPDRTLSILMTNFALTFFFGTENETGATVGNSALLYCMVDGVWV